MTDLTALRELLERAVELEAKSAEVDAPAAEVDAELAAGLAEFDDLAFAMAQSSPAEPDDFGWGEPVSFDAPKGDDGLEVKGWNPCPSCGSTNVDEYADGTARCEDCGTPLTGGPAGGLEGKDFDFEDDELDELVGFDEKALAGEDDEEWADEPGEVKADGGRETLSEIELLIARRNELTA